VESNLGSTIGNILILISNFIRAIYHIVGRECHSDIYMLIIQVY